MACHFAAGPAQPRYVSHAAFAPLPQLVVGCSQPAALLNASSYFSSGDFVAWPSQRLFVEPRAVGQ